MKKMSRIVGVMVVGIVYLSCSKESGKGSSSSNVTVTMKSTTLTSTARSADLFRPGGPRMVSRNTNSSLGTVVTVNSSSCVTMDSVQFCACTIANQAHGGSLIINDSGYCATPTKVGGGVSSVALFAVGRGSPRLLGGGMELSTDKTGALDVKAFDLKSVSQLTGEDNLSSETSTSSKFEGIQPYFSHIDVKMPALTISSANVYRTYRYLFYSQPITSESKVSTCGIDTPGLNNIQTNGNFISGVTFKRNDIMICEKTTSSATCADSDYKWLDVTDVSSNPFVSTRPTTESNIFKTGIVDDSNIDCSTSNGIPDMNIGGMFLLAELESAEQFNLTATNTAGKITYTYTAPSGTTTTGTTVSVTLDFNMSNMLFIKTGGTNLTTWISGNNAATIAKNTHFLPVYLRDALDSVFDGTGYSSRDLGLGVDATLSVQ